MTGKQRLILQGVGVDVDDTIDRFADNEDLYLSCLSRFSTESDINQLLDAIERNNPKECFEIAHSLKGVSANLGFTALYEEIAKLTDVFRANSMAYDTDNLSAVIYNFTAATEAISKL